MTQTMKVFNYIEANPGTTVKALESLVSSKKELADILNGLFVEGCVIPQMNAKFAIQLFAMKAPAQAETVETPAQANAPVVEETVTNADKKTFCTTFKNLEKQGKFVSIFNLRKALASWSRGKLDKAIALLRKEGMIQLHVADQSLMSDEEWASTIADYDGTPMGALTWAA